MDEKTIRANICDTILSAPGLFFAPNLWEMHVPPPTVIPEAIANDKKTKGLKKPTAEIDSGPNPDTQIISIN